MKIKRIISVSSSQKELLDKWVKGISTHIEVDGDIVCCPDFSCCVPELLAPESERILFVNDAIGDIRQMMATNYLQKAIAVQFPDQEAVIISDFKEYTA